MSWNVRPGVLIAISLPVLIYAWGTRKIWLRAGAGHGITIRRCACFTGANLALIASLISPLDAWSEALFSMHMVQHLLLIALAAPLLVVSDFPLALLWGLPGSWAHIVGRYLTQHPGIYRIWRFITNPIFAWTAFTLTLWGWHASRLFEAALRDEAIHALEHLCFLIAALLFWEALLRRTGTKEIHYAMALLYLFTTSMQSGILGALMTFSSQPWFPFYANTSTRLGISPLQDQQVAGLLMWMPGSAIFTLLAIGYFAAWLRAMELRGKFLSHRQRG